MTQVGDKYTNGKETLTITEVSASGRVKYQLNWQDRPSKYWSGMAYVLKNYPTKL
jgi:hypothetical protein